MIILKSFMISVLIAAGLYSAVSDFCVGKIPNVAIAAGAAFAIIGNILYFCIAGQARIWEFAINAFSAVLIAFAMYALHIWAGGDVKLFSLLPLLIPADLYKQKAPLPIVTIYILVFSVAFMYLVAESIVLFLKKEKAVSNASLRLSAKAVLSCMVSVITLQTILRLVFGVLYYEYLPVFLLLNVLLVLLFDKATFLSRPVSIIVCSIVSAVSVAFSLVRGLYTVDMKSIALAALVMVFRTLTDKYNYREIQAVDVKKGMVLSYGTILGFANSKVKGLPKYTTEDIATRISQEEADSIVRWTSSKYGKKTITVLRKMPFAFFIAVGFIIYLALGVLVW